MPPGVLGPRLCTLADELSVHASSPGLIVRRRVQRAVRIRSPLSREEAEEVQGAHREEEKRLLERHRGTADLLVGQRREAPEPVRNRDVVVVYWARARRVKGHEHTPH